MLYSARNIQERARMKEQLEASLDRVDIPEDIWEQAAEIQEALTEQTTGQDSGPRIRAIW